MILQVNYQYYTSYLQNTCDQDITLDTRLWGSIKVHNEGLKGMEGHSQLEHMRIRYHSIAKLPITEKRSMLFLTKYDKIVS